MRNLLKHIIYLTCLVMFLLLPFFAFAQNSTISLLQEVAETGGYEGGVDEFSLSLLIGDVIYGFLSLLGVIFVVLMIYGGFKWMKASGRSDEVEKAQNIIRQAIIGLIITVSSYAISIFVFEKLLT